MREMLALSCRIFASRIELGFYFRKASIRGLDSHRQHVRAAEIAVELAADVIPIAFGDTAAVPLLRSRSIVSTFIGGLRIFVYLKLMRSKRFSVRFVPILSLS